MPSCLIIVYDLLGLDLRVLLNSNLVVGLEGGNEVIWELGTSTSISTCCTPAEVVAWKIRMREVEAYVNPLISENSCVILPPLDSTSFFAFWSSSGEASGLRVTYSVR